MAPKVSAAILLLVVCMAALSAPIQVQGI
jgi:hypothetical protein